MDIYLQGENTMAFESTAKMFEEKTLCLTEDEVKEAKELYVAETKKSRNKAIGIAIGSAAIGIAVGVAATVMLRKE